MARLHFRAHLGFCLLLVTCLGQTGCSGPQTVDQPAPQRASGPGADTAQLDRQRPDACEAAVGVSCAEFEEAFLKASNPREEDRFGWSVALDGDTLAVGAPFESRSAREVAGDQAGNRALRSGAVYVFTLEEDVWKQQAYLKASNTGEDERFGAALALDGNDLIVGAPDESSSASGVDGDQTDNGAQNSGAVYIRRIAR